VPGGESRVSLVINQKYGERSNERSVHIHIKCRRRLKSRLSQTGLKHFNQLSKPSCFLISRKQIGGSTTRSKQGWKLNTSKERVGGLPK
jgi:CDP-diacylglycerol pyrophosphatase